MDGVPRAALLLLADGRLPAGGYAHSGGLEPAVEGGHVRSLDDVRRFATGRLLTVGRVAATFAAAANLASGTGDAARMDSLDAGLEARMPSPAARATSRQLGRQLVRVAGTMVAADRLNGLGVAPHQPLAFGAVGAAFGLGPHDTALAVLHEAVTGVVTAAVRLLSLDPLSAYATIAACRGSVDDLAARAADECTGDVPDLPADAAPLLDLLAQAHSRRAGRLFAS